MVRQIINKQILKQKVRKARRNLIARRKRAVRVCDKIFGRLIAIIPCSDKQLLLIQDQEQLQRAWTDNPNLIKRLKEIPQEKPVCWYGMAEWSQRNEDPKYLKNFELAGFDEVGANQTL